MQRDALVHKLNPNVPRIIASIYRIILLAQSRQKNLSQYDIVKTLFLADREHLNEWGRPITYDNYVAMKHGPVATLSYDLLKGNASALRKHQIQNLPWTSTLVSTGSNIKHFKAVVGAVDVDDFLSESDLEALDHALSDVLRLGFGQIRRLTHEDPAYLEAWKEDGGREAYDMKLGLLFETPNYEHAELVADQSHYV